MRSWKLRHKVMQTKAQIEYFHCAFLGVPWFSGFWYPLACWCLLVLLSLGHGASANPMRNWWINLNQNKVLNCKGSENEASVGLNSAYIMLDLSCRATEWIRTRRWCCPHRCRCNRKVSEAERFNGSGNPSRTHRKKMAQTEHWILVLKWFHP